MLRCRGGGQNCSALSSNHREDGETAGKTEVKLQDSTLSIQGRSDTFRERWCCVAVAALQRMSKEPPLPSPLLRGGEGEKFQGFPPFVREVGLLRKNGHRSCVGH